MENEERDAVIKKELDGCDTAGADHEWACEKVWNAAVTHERERIADELEQVRLGTGDMFNALADYIKQLREK